MLLAANTAPGQFLQRSSSRGSSPKIPAPANAQHHHRCYWRTSSFCAHSESFYAVLPFNKLDFGPSEIRDLHTIELETLVFDSIYNPSNVASNSHSCLLQPAYCKV